MARFKKGHDLDQQYLLPPSIRDWLPEEHLAWYIHDAVASVDTDGLLDRYRVCGKGELAYDPRMMLRVLIYAYCTGVFSSRKIARHLEESVPFRVLAANQMPDHRTICRFRSEHADLFEGFFVQIVQLASEAGLAKLGTVAVDGSKVKANASKRKSMSYARMKSEEKRIRVEIRRITEMAKGIDREEDELFGPDFRGDELPAELSNRKSRLKVIQAAKKRLEERKAAEDRQRDEERARKAKEDGRELGKVRSRKHPKGKPLPKDQENFTDPDSRIMKDSGGFEQCYNAQVAVDQAHRLIIANGLTNNAADVNQLIPMAEEAMANAGKPIRRLLADAGYRSEENFEHLENAQIDAFVSVGKEGKISSEVDLGRQATRRMKRKLKTRRGRGWYRKRKHIAEPVFGWIKHVIGFRTFTMRGLAKASAEWNLVCLAINLRRLHGKLAL
jgi:transposase